MEKMNIKEIKQYIENKTNQSTDLNTRIINLNTKKLMYVFYESTSSDDKISNFFMKSVSKDVKEDNISIFTNLFKNLQNTIPNSKLKILDKLDDVFYHLASGFTCIFVDNNDKYIAIETKNKLDRDVSEPTTEAVVRGPKDCFTENYMTNIGLIRKRIKDANLWIDETKIGRRTNTKVSILYLKDVVELSKVKRIKEKLAKIDIDGIIDSGYIREFLVKSNRMAFPKMISTERPDITCTSLLNGKIVILVENTPFVLIIPGLFIDYFESAEDNYQKPLNASFTKLLRYLSFFITLLTPAIYIAIMTYNAEIIPDKLLTSLAIQRQGVPFPTFVSVILLLTTFEILRESDIRMPSLMGASISIVGALVLGDAAVQAGIVSPFVVIIVATTSVSGLLFTDIDFVNAIRWWRILFMFGAISLGIIGIVTVGIIFIAKLCSLECLDTPYLSPISPFNLKVQGQTFIRLKRNKLKYRNSDITEKNIVKLGDIDEI